MRTTLAITLMLGLAACGAATGPAGQRSPTAVNPETGSTGAASK